MQTRFMKTLHARPDSLMTRSFPLPNDRTFSYPWHRYYADTDCIWMAIELHPL